jgi:lysozyme
MSRLKKGSAIAVLAVSVVSGAEGYRQNAYPDPATRGVPWTICYGHTESVRPGDHKSFEECKALLLADLDKYGDKVEACITREMPIKVEVAFLSLAYNIGTGGFCKSSVAKLYNAGDGKGACDAMLRFNRAAGVVFPGLTNRRTKERRMCLEGLAE